MVRLVSICMRAQDMTSTPSNRKIYLLVATLAIVLTLWEAGFAFEICPANSEIDEASVFIDQTYRDVVNRPADPQGKQFHLDQIKNLNSRVCRSGDPLFARGTCEWNNNAQIVLGMLNSPESVSKNGNIASNPWFVTVLYKVLLRRAPDNVGLASHVRFLDSGGTRVGLVAQFLLSDEYRNRFGCNAQSNERVTNARKGRLQLGVNGHPLRPHGPYSQAEGVSLDEQLTDIKNLGADWYRFDVGLPSTGQDFPGMDSLVKAAQEHGVQLLPVLFPTIDRDHDTLAAIQQKSYDGAFRFVSRYKSSIHVYELSNEQDVYSASGAPNGDQVGDYDPRKFGIVAAMLRGLADGVRAADGNAMRIIDFAGWLHTGFFQLVEDQHIPYEIVGVHWYQNMGEITCPGQAYPCPARPLHFNVIQRLEAITHGKPMWFTETNYSPLPNLSVEANMQRKEQYLVPTLQRYQELANVYPFEVVMIYELFDEPNVGGGAEQTQVGLMSVTRRADGKYVRGAPKPTYQSVQRMFKR